MTSDKIYSTIISMVNDFNGKKYNTNNNSFSLKPTGYETMDYTEGPDIYVEEFWWGTSTRIRSYDDHQWHRNKIVGLRNYDAEDHKLMNTVVGEYIPSLLPLFGIEEYLDIAIFNNLLEKIDRVAASTYRYNVDASKLREYSVYPVD